jgi:hypothetical protein
MAITISIDTKPFLDKVNGMLAKIDHFKRVDIGTGLSEFQVQDMHRHRPFTMRSRAKGQATTKIRPHSLFEMKRSIKAQRRVLRVHKSLAAGKRVRRKSLGALRYERTSTRPILREEMYSVLMERMIRLRDEKLKWSGSSGS